MGCNSSLLSLEKENQLLLPDTPQVFHFSNFIRANNNDFFKTYKFGSWINRSCTAMVRKGIHKLSETERVVKIYHRERENQQKAMNEINALSRLDHPNIVKIYEYFMDQSFIYIILEKIDGLPLYDHLLGVDEGVMKNFPSIFKQILMAVEHCHSNGIVHRNITPDNVLIYKSEGVTGKFSYVVKLIDFGQAYFLPKSRIEIREKERKEKLDSSKLRIQDIQESKRDLLNEIDSNQKLGVYPSKNQLTIDYRRSNTKKYIKQSSSNNSRDRKSESANLINQNQSPVSKLKIENNAPEVHQKTGDKKRPIPFRDHKTSNQYLNSAVYAPFSEGNRGMKKSFVKKQRQTDDANFLYKIITKQTANRTSENKDAEKSQQKERSNDQNIFQKGGDMAEVKILDISNNDIELLDIRPGKKINMARNTRRSAQSMILPQFQSSRRGQGYERDQRRQNSQIDLYTHSQRTKLKSRIIRKISQIYSAPEACQVETIQKQDIWFCGILLFTLVTGKNLLAQSRSARECVQKIIEVWAFDHPEADQISDMMKRILSISPQDRPPAYDCLDHKFLRKNTEGGSQWKLTMVYKFLHDYKVEHRLKSLFAMYISRQISTVNDQAQFLMEFSNLDTNNDGKLQKEELLQGLINSFTLDYEAAVKYVDEIFITLDKNQNGTIQFSQFLMGTQNLSKVIKDENIVKLFKEIDQNANGYISREQLSILFEGVDDRQSFQQFMDMDRESSNGINLQEFSIFIKQMMKTRSIA